MSSFDAALEAVGGAARAAADAVGAAVGRLGGDPSAMRRAAHEFDQQAERIRSYGELMSAEIHQMWWHGSDADKFRAAWDQVHLRASHRIAGELYRLAARLRQEAAKQEGVSR